ncbi:MAG: DUF3891 family protein [Candidatus Methylomirabilales bacterium]
MIRRPYDNGWVVISQMDHARLSGALMARWGNETFAPPIPQAEALFAISEHDNGWDEWERAPEIHPETGYPLQFNELRFEPFSAIWRRGTERHRKARPYTSLILALHAASLARRRLEKASRPHEGQEGDRFLGEEWPDTEAARLSTFIAEMEQLRMGLFDAVMAESRRKREELQAECTTNFRLLQVGDVVSLELCCGLCEPFTIDQVPALGGGHSLSVKFEPVSKDTVAVSPYPFSQRDVTVAVRGRILRQKVFTSPEELGSHLGGADPIHLSFCLRPA